MNPGEKRNVWQRYVLRIRITNENICMATLVAVTATTTNTIFKTK